MFSEYLEISILKSLKVCLTCSASFFTADEEQVIAVDSALKSTSILKSFRPLPLTFATGLISQSLSKRSFLCS